MRCAGCPFPQLPTVPSEVNTGARLVVVGEGPGGLECSQGRPFVGPSGKLMMRELRSLGARRQDISWLNAINCPVHDKDGQKAARKACSSRLQQDMAQAVQGVERPIIMPVGALGLQGAMGLKARPEIRKWRGSISTTDPKGPTAGALVAPTIHPAFVLRSPGWAPVFHRDVQRVERLLNAPWRPPEDAPHRQLLITRTAGELDWALENLGTEVSGDVETVGLGPTETELVCLGFSDGALTVVVPWSRGRNGKDPWWHSPSQVARIITRALSGRVMVTHNGPNFDHIVMARYGISWGAWEDTLLAAHVVASHLPKNLAHVVTQYIDVPPWKLLEDRTATIERLWTYNGRDCLYTILAWQQIKKEITCGHQ